MLNFNSIMIFSEKPDALTAFYSKVFDKKPDWEGGGYSGFQVGTGWVGFGPHSEVHGESKDPKRIMISLETSDVEGEFERIKSIGAHVIAEPYHPGGEDEGQIATFADPDGNFFQLMTPWSPEDMKKEERLVN